MPETPKPSNEQAFKNFVEKYNLEPLNLEAINNCLFAQEERINEIAKNVFDMRGIGVNRLNYNRQIANSLFDKWNNQ